MQAAWRHLWKLMLLWTWAAGIILVGVSLYLTHFDVNRAQAPFQKQQSPRLNFTIYTAPKIFEGTRGQRQLLALRSWLNLAPAPCVIFLSRDPTVMQIVSNLDPATSCVSVESSIDFTYQGVPYFHSMVARARATENGVAVLLNPETVLLPGFVDVLKHFADYEHDWLLVAESMNLSSFPFDLEQGRWRRTGGQYATVQEVQDYATRNRELSNEKSLWAWNVGKVPLHAGVLPAFIYGAGYHDDWLLHESLNSNFRVVVDVSEAVFPIGGGANDHVGEAAKANTYLSQRYGSYSFRDAEAPLKPIKLRTCGRQYCFAWNGNGTEDQLKQETGGEISLKTGFRDSSRMLWLLHQVASQDKVIILTVVSIKYRDMLMSWVCRLRALNISNYLVAATDVDIYEYGILQGLPIFGAGITMNDSDCVFGSNCFKKVTKLKSKTVLQILQLGYNVLFSDVDVYWFSSPVEELMSFGAGVLPAQTDEYNETEPVNLPRRLNSGFYLARSDNATVTAFRKIVKHAAKSKLSEQPSFYDVLCGEGGRNRQGDSVCVEPETNLTVVFLDRRRYPNGGYRLIWESPDVKQTCKAYGCVILHNNWKTGSQQKTKRQMRTGIWDYDPESRMCSWGWQNENSKPIF